MKLSGNGLDRKIELSIFVSTLMVSYRKAYSPVQMISAVMMIFALLWLTVSAPFVVAGQKEIAKYEKLTNHNFTPFSSEDDAANPFGNNTEEKCPNSSSFSEEYLHDHNKSDYAFSIIARYHKCESAGTYIAYHGELLVPPPNQA